MQVLESAGRDWSKSRKAVTALGLACCQGACPICIYRSGLIRYCFCTPSEYRSVTVTVVASKVSGSASAANRCPSVRKRFKMSCIFSGSSKTKQTQVSRSSHCAEICSTIRRDPFFCRQPPHIPNIPIAKTAAMIFRNIRCLLMCENPRNILCNSVIHTTKSYWKAIHKNNY